MPELIVPKFRIDVRKRKERAMRATRVENDKGGKTHLKAESTGVGIKLRVGTVKIKLGMVD